MDMLNPVRLRTGSPTDAEALAAYVRECGAPVRIEGLRG